MKKSGADAQGLVHLLINFDDGPAYEVVCRSFGVEGEARSSFVVKLDELSKVLSHALRHEPWLYELELDDEGCSVGTRPEPGGGGRMWARDPTRLGVASRVFTR